MLSLATIAPAAALVSAWLLATIALRGRARRFGFSPSALSDFSWSAGLGALIGARLFYVIQHWALFVSYPQDVVLTLWHGLSFYGGLLGAVVAGCLYARSKGLSVRFLADVVAPALPLGVALARLGMLSYYAFVLGLEAIGSAALAVDLLEALLCLGLFVTTSYPPRSGGPSPFLLALGGYGLLRAVLDLWRPGGEAIITDQTIAFLIVIVSLAFLIRDRRKSIAQIRSTSTGKAAGSD